MFLAPKLLLALWNKGVGGSHHFSITQSVHTARKEGLWTSSTSVYSVAQIAQIVSLWPSWQQRRWTVRFTVSLMPCVAMALPLPAMFLESRVPGLVKEYLDAILPEQAQIVTHSLFVAGPSIFLSGFFPAWSVLKIACEVVGWFFALAVAIVLVAVETALYASTLLLLASMWAFVYRDVARYVLLRSSSKYRSTIRAREILDLVDTSFSLDGKFFGLQAQLDALLPARGQFMAHDFFPFEALDVFDSENAALWRQDAAYFASWGADASLNQRLAVKMAPGLCRLAKLLEAKHKAVHRNPLEDPLAHFFSTAHSLAALAIQPFHPPPLFQMGPSVAHRPSFLRLFLPFLLTYPGYLFIEYLSWRKNSSIPARWTSSLDSPSNEPRRKALGTVVCLASHIAQRCDLDPDQAAQLLPLLTETEPARARAKKAEDAAHRAILDAVLDWKNRKNALEILRLKQD